MLCYAKSLQSCPTLCDPIDGSPPGSPIPGILQARTLRKPLFKKTYASQACYRTIYSNQDMKAT